MGKVCCVNAANYDLENVQNAIDRTFALLEIESKIKPEFRVLIKPNLLMKRRPEEATTTHPQVILAVISKLKSLGVKDIVVADSPGGLYNKTLLLDIYNASGMKGVADKTGAALNINVEYEPKGCLEGIKCKSFNIIKPVHDADFIISVGKVKTHGMTTMSGGVKNLFGCVPGLQKPELHCRFNKTEDFCEMLVDLALCIKPNLTIMDGIVCMEGDGPSGGNPKECNFIVGSVDVFSLDVFLSKKIGLNPENVPTVLASSKRGLCSLNFDDLKLIGDSEAFKFINDFKMPKSSSVDFIARVPKVLQKPVNFLVNKCFISKPIINFDKCIGCGKCAESCPNKTIDIKDRKAIINYKNCIKCFCCHEMCPVRAIKIGRRVKEN